MKCLRRNPERSAKHAYHTGMNVGIVYCTCGHFLHKETEVNRTFVKYTMDLLSVPEYVIKKGRPHGHRYGKKPGHKEYFLATQLKKKCKKKQFRGIHDRFLRDQEFRIRMVEHHRDEEICQRWDALADEDHTRHLTEIEYFHYKNKWWLHSNKQGSNTMPLRHRSDFKQALSTLRRLKQEAGEEPHVRTNKGSWHRVHLLHGGIGKARGGLLTIQKVKKEASQVLSERGDPLLIVFGENLRKGLSRIKFILLQMDRLQPGECKYNTSNDPFSRCNSVQRYR